MSLMDYVRELNASVADLASQEKSKNLRKKLINTGIFLLVVGIVGVIVSFILFATAGSNAFSENGFSARLLVPFCMFPIFGIVTAIGGVLLHSGLAILLGGAASKIIDKSINKHCPYCGKPMKPDEIFCSKCGGRRD